MASIIIPTNDNPTPPERKGWVGAAWGTLAAIIPSAIASFINPLLGLAVTAATIIGGYFIGKNKGEKLQEKELREGKKEVKEPTFWNRGAAKGWAMGSLISVAAGAFFHMTAYTSISQKSLLINTVGFVTGLLSLALPIIGGIKTKGDMRKEYAQAQEIAEAERQKTLVTAVEKGRAPQPEVAQAPQPETAKFTQAESERRANLLIDIKDIPPDTFRSDLQKNFEHHGITGLNLTPAMNRPGVYTLSWKESTTGVRGLLNDAVGAEEERVRTAVEKSGGIVYSEKKSPPGLNPNNLFR